MSLNYLSCEYVVEAGSIDELLHVKRFNAKNIQNNFAKLSPMLGHDFETSCAKLQGNRFKIDAEIDEKHALQIILS